MQAVVRMMMRAAYRTIQLVNMCWAVQAVPYAENDFVFSVFGKYGGVVGN